MIQQITYDSRIFAYIIQSGGPLPESTTFITPGDCNQQVGYIVYPKGGEIIRHYHTPVERVIVGTTEVLFILKGRCLVDFYADDQQLITTKELMTGDLVVIVAGGHGFQMLADTVMLEVKQGPYPGVSEKVKF